MERVKVVARMIVDEYINERVEFDAIRLRRGVWDCRRAFGIVCIEDLASDADMQSEVLSLEETLRDGIYFDVDSVHIKGSWKARLDGVAVFSFNVL